MRHDALGTAGAVAVVLLLVGCAEGGGAGQVIEAEGTAKASTCQSRLTADYVPSEEFGHGTPEEALQAFAAKSRAGYEFTLATVDRDFPAARDAVLAQDLAFSQTAADARIMGPAPERPEGALLATSTSEGRVVAEFVVQRAPEGPPRWAVSFATAELPDSSCAAVDQLQQQEQERRVTADPQAPTPRGEAD